jgi:hypothetical protein
MTDDMTFEGWLIDGNSLNSSVMYCLYIFINRCKPAFSISKMRKILNDTLSRRRRDGNRRGALE